MKIPLKRLFSLPPSPQDSGQSTLPAPLRWIEILAVVCVLTAAAPTLRAADAEAPPPEEFGKVYQCHPGPWGDLEYYYIYVEAPDRVVDHLAMPEPTPKWNFPGATVEKLRALFDTAGLPSALQDYLLSPSHHVLDDDVLTVFPPVPDLLAMTQEQRSVIYAELAKSALNPLYLYPARIFHGDLEAWLADTSLRPEICDAVRKLTYMKGDMLCFSDAAAILSMAESETEARAFMKTMTRTRSLVLQMKVKSRVEFQDTIRYWTAERRNREISSLILPSPESRDVQHVDCSHLLPPLARRYLYTYPSEEMAISASMPDCTWTSLNFFSSSPLNYQADDKMFLMRLNEDYEKVEPPYAFGDVLMYFDHYGVAMHSCVYIADDIVYTKNGQNRASPWILSKMSDMKRLYSNEQYFSVQGYRLKPDPDESAQ